MAKLDELLNRLLLNVPSHIDNNPDMLLTDNSHTFFIDYSGLVDINDDTMSDINICYSDFSCYPFWHYIDGKYYFLKKRDSILSILNELINAEIAKIIGLDTIKPMLAVDDIGIIGTISENFRKPNVTYIHTYNLTCEELVEINKILKSKWKGNNEFKLSLAKYIMRNVFTSLNDRHENTLFIRGEHLELAPSFDGEASFSMWKKNCYDDGFLIGKKDYSLSFKELKRMIRSDKVFSNLYEQLYYLKMNDVLRQVEETHGIKIEDDVNDYYLEFEELRKTYLSLTLK